MEGSNENNIQNGEEDDFEDFGGFEAADPVLPNVAQSASGLPAGVQATPTPWAVFSAGNVSVQPDLLCGQNRFPAHLDTPTTVDVASGAVASEENGEPAISSTMDRANGLFDREHDLTDELEPELDLDQINLANDILDGSFRTSSSQSGASFMSHGREQMPDISALDLGITFENRTLNNAEVVNRTESDNLQASDARHPGSVEASSGAAQNVQVSGISANENDTTSLRGAVGGAREEANERTQNRSCDNRNAESAEVDRLRSLLETAEQDKQTVEQEKLATQKELEEQLVCNAKVEEDLQRAKELAETAQSQYDKLQEEHKKQLEELRQAGHQTLTVVVEEYKELLKTTVLQQQQEWNQQLRERLTEESQRFQTLLEDQEWNQQLSERLTEESQRFQPLLEDQSEKFNALQREERKKTEDRVKEAIEEMRETEQAAFEKELSEERKKTEEGLAEAVQKERDKSQQEIERVIEEERRKAQEQLDKEQEKLKTQLSEEVIKTQEALCEALNRERQNSKEELDKMLDEERKQSREMAQQSVAATREEMKEYLQEQRKRDKALQQRQLTSLDLFLESARQQLKLVMDNNMEQTENDENS